MLLDVVEALKCCEEIAGIAVVTAEDSVAEILPGVKLISENGAVGLNSSFDLNSAVTKALAELASITHQPVIVMPADIPRLNLAEFRAVLKKLGQAFAENGESSIGILPSYDGMGTNLLALCATIDFRIQFGEDSFNRHLEQAETKGYRVLELKAQSIAQDIDYPEDIDSLLRAFEGQAELPAANTRSLFSKTLAARAEDAKDLACWNGQTDAEMRSGAAQLRDQYFGNRVTYSRKVFIPLTRLCRDVCHYCTFATTPGKLDLPYLSPEAVLDIAREGEKMGCKEALFTLGEKPELRYQVAREALQQMGHKSTVEYIASVAQKVLDETGLLPHINAGCLSFEDFQLLRPVSASMGIMLENLSPRLCEKGQPHYGSPDKDPLLRLRSLADAGRAKVPMTTGILIGIGETRQERLDSLVAICDLHRRYGHIQEVIIQNFVAKSDTRMAMAKEPDIAELLWTISVARLIFGAQMSIQAPPNLNSGHLNDIIAAGINDWGGVSPLTPDHVNPESPWPHVDQLAQATSNAGKILQQRLTIYPDYITGAGNWLDKSVRPAVLKLVDGEGLARQDSWLSGVSEQPEPEIRKQVIGLGDISPSSVIRRILDRAAANKGRELSEHDIARLFSARGDDFIAVCRLADALRKEAVGDTATYVVNRNINYTNICTYSCSFCAFSKGRTRSNVGDHPYLKSPGEIADLAMQAAARGATEICLQGGIHPSFDGQTYLDICSAVHRAKPDIHIHAFSPLEISHGAQTLGLSMAEFLRELQSVGLRSMPGTAAEILHDEVRQQICPDKLNTSEWLKVIETAHQLGLPTTATIMFGHLDSYQHWAAHLQAIRQLQQRTGGFTEFVPLPFVAHEAPVYRRGLARRGPTLRESVLMHAVARIVFHSLIDNVQASWVKLGLEGAALCLHAGANDLGGVLMNESITRAAGAQHGQMMEKQGLRHAIQAARRIPQRRNTLYQFLAETSVSDSGVAKGQAESRISAIAV